MKKIVLLTGVVALLSGCAGGMSPVGCVNAFISNVKGPITATNNTAISKTGVSCAENILGLSASGDASILTAARNANITRVTTVDYSTDGIYPFYGKTCVIVTGE